MEPRTEHATPDLEGKACSERATELLVSRLLDATRVALLWGVTFAVAVSGPLLMGRMGHF